MTVLSEIARRKGRGRRFGIVGRAYVPVDRFLGRLAGGRLVALGHEDLPSLLQTTTGQRTDAPRRTPLMYAPDGDALAVIGSNFGGARRPDWTANLLANPIAVVTQHGKTVNVCARRFEGAGRERLRDLLVGVWPGYLIYERQAGARRLRTFAWSGSYDHSG